MASDAKLRVGLWEYSPPEVDGIWGIWGSDYIMAKTIFYLLKGDYTLWNENSVLLDT